MRIITRTAAVLRTTATIAMAVALAACGDITGMSSDGTPAVSSVASPAAASSGAAPTSSNSSGTSTASAAPAPAADTSAQQSVEFTAQTYSVAQHAGAVTLTVTRTGSASTPATVNYSTTDGTAVAGTDYERVEGTLEWAENDSTPKTISVPINSAAAFTGNKAFGVVLVDPSAKASVGNPGNAIVNIAGSATASAGSVKLSSPTYTVSKTGNTVTVSVVRSGGSSGAVSLAYATADGTAVAGKDFTATQGVLEWADGDASAKTFSVAVGGSKAFSGARQFSVMLSNPRSGVALASPASATVVVTGNGAPAVGTFEFGAASYAVGQGTPTLVVPVLRTNGTSGAASVYVQTVRQTASYGVDYARQQTQLKWADGDASPKSITLTLLNTSPFTGTRTLRVVLNTPSAGAKIGNPGAAWITIDGSGSAPVGRVELSAPSYSIGQNNGPLKVSVRRVGGSHGTISVAYAETGNTAVAGRDFTAASGTLRWADGDFSPKVLTIGISNAQPFSGTRSFTIALSAPTGGTALSGPSSAIATITGSASAAVGSVQFSGAAYRTPQTTGQVAIAVHRTGGSAGAISVTYATSNGSAVAGTDFTATQGTLHWADGDAASQAIWIPISNAKPFSGTKSFDLSLSAPTGGATLGTPVAAVVTIAGSSAPSAAPPGALQLSTSTYAVSQQSGTLNVSVNRTGGSAGVTSVKYATTDGTAIAGKDYTAASGTLQWNDGDTASKQVPIQVNSTNLFSGSKAFTVGISGATGGATLGTPTTATARIDGAAPAAIGSLELSSTTYTVAQNAGKVDVTVNRTGGFAGAVSVNYSTSNGSAAAGSDYTATSGTLYWADGDATAKTLSIPVSNATPFSGSKSLTVSLAGAGGGAGLGSPSSASVTITGSGISSGGGSTVSGPVFWVYHNGVFNWTADFSFLAAINYKDTATTPLSGPYTIGVSIVGAYGGFQPYSVPGFDTTPYKYLIFSIKPTVNNQVIGTGFDANNDVADGVPLTIAGPQMTKYGPVPVAGQWNSYKIPLADFGFNNPSVLKFSIADGTGNITNLFYVDNVGFTTQ
jgi:hypothetical protein